MKTLPNDNTYYPEYPNTAPTRVYPSYPVVPQYPAPCPGCGRCPVCGRRDTAPYITYPQNWC